MIAQPKNVSKEDIDAFKATGYKSVDETQVVRIETTKYFKFLVSGAVNGLVELRPAPVLALGCLAMGLYYVALALLDADQDGQFTVADIKLILRGATNYLTGRPTPPTQPVKRE